MYRHVDGKGIREVMGKHFSPKTEIKNKFNTMQKLSL